MKVINIFLMVAIVFVFISSRISVYAQDNIGASMQPVYATLFNEVRYEIVLQAMYEDFSNDRPFIKIGNDSYPLDNRRGEKFYFEYVDSKGMDALEFCYGTSFYTPATSVTYFAMEDGTIKFLGEQKCSPMKMPLGNFSETDNPWVLSVKVSE